MSASRDQRAVLYVNHEVECGGAEHSLLELIEGLDRERFTPHLVCSMAGPLTDRASDLGAQVHLVPMLFSGRLRKFFGLIGATRGIRRLIAQFGIQIVHTNSLVAGYCGILAAKLCNVPTVWHARDVSYPAAARKFCTQATHVIANSEATAESLEFPDRHAVKLCVVYNGVGPQFFSQPSTRGEVRLELNVAPDEQLVGIFARLDPWKGHADLLEASRHVLHTLPKTTFVIVGDTLFDGSRQRHANFRTELEQLAQARGVWGKVRFLGQRTDVVRLMAAMDVIVQPSSTAEPFGRSLAEAQAVGVPVIGSALGGIPEVIEDEYSGLLFPPGDVTALAAQLSRVLSDHDLARTLSHDGREWAQARFTRKRHAGEVQAIYDGL